MLNLVAPVNRARYVTGPESGGMLVELIAQGAIHLLVGVTGPRIGEQQL